MAVRLIQSPQNARLKELRRALRDPAPASADGTREQVVGVEGPKLIAEALRASLRFHCVFAANGADKILNSLELPQNVEVLLVSREVLNSALSTETPQPVAALVQPPDWTWAHLLKPQYGGAPLVLILAGLQDPGNLGTILRSAEAFGATGVVSLPGTVSPWNSKVVRASAGSVFRVPLIASGERSCFEKLLEAGVRVLGTTVRAADPVNLADMTAAVAFLIGNESNGISTDLARKADATVTIPCPGPVESLNAAVAASVILYEAAQQRSALAGGPSERRGARR